MSDECAEETLKTGERVRCHPDGRKVLIPGLGSLRAHLNAVHDDTCAAHTELKQAAQDRLHAAQQSLADGDAVPPEKRVI